MGGVCSPSLGFGQGSTWASVQAPGLLTQGPHRQEATCSLRGLPHLEANMCTAWTPSHEVPPGRAQRPSLSQPRWCRLPQAGDRVLAATQEQGRHPPTLPALPRHRRASAQAQPGSHGARGPRAQGAEGRGASGPGGRGLGTREPDLAGAGTQGAWRVGATPSNALGFSTNPLRRTLSKK